MIIGFDKPKLLIINRPFFFFLSEGKTKFMKTIQEIDEERNENQQNDADELMQRMFSFIPLDGKHPTSAIISAKFCAKVACDYLYENLPNINETPPNSRNDERTYKQYWNGVKRKLEAFKAVAEKEEILYLITMHKSIDKLIRKYQERNKTLLNKNPRIGIEFDWSPESFEYSHNEGFIRDLRKILD